VPIPQMHAVESRSVAKIGYDPAAEAAYVEFHGGGLYAYHGVPPSVYDELLSADSKGTFVNTAIKPRYSVRKVRLALDRTDGD
jgi:KTSC domain